MQLVFSESRTNQVSEINWEIKEDGRVGCFAIQNQKDGMPEINLIDTASSRWASGLGTFDQIDALLGGLFENG